MIQRLAVLGDSILRGVVLDEASGRYVHLKESCVAGAQQQLGLSIDNFSRFGMTSEKGLQVARQRLPEQGGYDACLICFGGNDVDHCWKQVAEDPQGENPPHVACGRYIENMGQMVEDVRLAVGGRCPVRFYGRAGGMVPEPDEITAVIAELEREVR